MKHILFILLIFMVKINYGQDIIINFDDRELFDKSNYTPIDANIILNKNDTNNIWQVGVPQKTLFDSAASLPIALMTDTINFYPSNNESEFVLVFYERVHSIRIRAIRWMQKIDMEDSTTYAKVLISFDKGITFESVFNNSNVYNFFGYDPNSVGVLPDSSKAFVGVDTNWRDVWLCINGIYDDSIMVKYVFHSDSVINNHEGWMVDNFRIGYTFQHTINEIEANKNLVIYPNPTADMLSIALNKEFGHHVMKKIVMINMQGQQVNSWDCNADTINLDVSKYSTGNYKLEIHTNLKKLTKALVIQ